MVNVKTIIVALIIILIVAVGAFAFISANSHNTKVDILSNDTLQNGDIVQIQLNDEFRNVYPNEVVDIKILDDSGWANKYQVTTDENGEGSIVLSTYENGNYTIHTNYNGTLFNKPYHGVNSLVIDDGYDEYYY
jgi:hypothetical protein